MCTNNIFACGIQESRRLRSDIAKSIGFVVLQYGFEQKRRRNRRFSGSVTIVLSPDAKNAWNSAGSQVFHFLDRIH